MSYDSTILANSPAVFWPLDDASVTTIADSSGNAHAGTVTARVAFTPGQPSLLRGDPSASSIAIDDAQIDASPVPGPGTGDFAMEAWFKTSITGYTPIVTFGMPSLGLSISSGTVLAQDLNVGDGSLNVATPTATYNDGHPHHVFAVRRSGMLYLYVDGAPVGTPKADTYDFGPSGPLRAADQYNFTGGNLQKVAFYVGTVTDAMVLAHYNAGTGGGGDTTPPVVSSANVDISGTILTINFTEAGSPPVLPAAGATGFNLSASGGAATLSSPWVSGTTYRATISRTIAAGETLTLAYAPGNLTDSASPTNPMASFSGTGVTNNSTHAAPLTSGTASFVSSGPGAIVVTCADATRGTPSYTYQWQRNTDGGSYANLSGATTRSLTDGSAATGHLYGYRMVTTDSAGTPASVASNAVTAQVYSGGPPSVGIRRVTLGGGF